MGEAFSPFRLADDDRQLDPDEKHLFRARLPLGSPWPK